uniref:LacI family DNA-binding transcriptional regulator n=1 Tax=Collinsella sp. TaxID=1965294 RepID=UPI003FEED478
MVSSQTLGTTMAVTAKQIADQLGISAAAVSLALNNRRGVSEKTRQLVLSTA